MSYRSTHPIAYVTCDVVAFAISGERLHVLLVDRGEEPLGWALPGGFVQPDEDLADAAVRELVEETDVHPGALPLEQLGTYGRPDRDLRYAAPPTQARVVTVAWLAVLPEAVPPTGGSDASAAQWRPVDEVLGEQLAFDHDQILRDGLDRLRAKLDYTPAATAFLPPEFTLAELRRVNEIILGKELDPGNFQRKMRASAPMVAETGALRQQPRGRPAATYRPLRPSSEALRPGS